MIKFAFLSLAIVTTQAGVHTAAANAPTHKIGAAKVDITPDYPVRLSGYGSRRVESEGVAQKLWAKAIAIGDDGGNGPALLLSVENCGMTPAIRGEVAKRLKETADVNSERLVITVTHTHTAPCLTNWAPFLFGSDIPEEHQQRIDRYTKELTEKLVNVATEALANRRPANLFWTRGSVDFAVNRRVIKEGRWTGFGEQSNGPVDHRLPILAAKDENGKLIGIVANYACHCTTLGGNFNQICGDWAGYAQEFIEQDNAGAVALITIGCGADANPKPRGELQQCKQHGRKLADEVKRLLAADLKPLTEKLACKSVQIDLPFDKLPTKSEWEERAKQGGARGYHARKFLERIQNGQKISTSVPYPVATWRFGDELAMVFLGGEVVVDYAMRLDKEFDADRLWVTAYANTVPCYIPSKRILREGGYEADYSMIYYARPTRLAESVEDLIFDAVQKLLPAGFYAQAKQTDFPPPKSPNESLQAIKAPGMTVELVADEPLVVDPVAFDWGPDGRLWVVEMRDYPNGLGWKREGGPLGKPGGRIKVLEDFDGDGRYDKATLFLDKIPFPTGIKVWRDGILVTAAPEIFYAEDSDNDGTAEKREVLYRGFGEGNQQHRVNGLRWGLDNWLYVGNGDSGGTIKSLRTGKVVNVNGRDLRIRPDEGLIDAQSGQTQFGRCRDDWGNWFGGNNSNPMWHYVLKDHYLRRNPHVSVPNVKQHVSVQPGAAPVFPVSRTLARFNDLNRANRFTSACSPIIYRDELLGAARSGDRPQQMQSFVCEPVHNLVHREVVVPKGITFTSRRPDSEKSSEFLASADNWFRPAMVRTGPDGALWIADMYRFVIEHPKWIPIDWQRKLDLRAGDDKGRIYRVTPQGVAPRKNWRLDKLDVNALVKALDSPNGWQRDTAQQMLIWRGDKSVVPALEELAASSKLATARLHGLCTLDGLNASRPPVLIRALADPHPGVRRHAIRLSEPLINESPELGDAVSKRIDDPDSFVQLQLAYSLGAWKDDRAGRLLATLAMKHREDPDLSTAVLSSVGKHNVRQVLAGVLAGANGEPPPDKLIRRMFGLAAALGDDDVVQQVMGELTKTTDEPPAQWKIAALAGLLDVLQRQKKTLDDASLQRIKPLVAAANSLIASEASTEAEKLSAIQLVARPSLAAAKDADRLSRFLDSRYSPKLQSATASALERLGSSRTAAALLDGWRSHSPALRSQILDILLSRTAWTSQLVRAIEIKDLSAAHIDASRRQKLLSHENSTIRNRAAKVFGGATAADRQKVLDKYAKALTLTADASRGKQVFAKRCANCHRLDEVGHPVGPDLAALTDKSPHALLVAILDPNRAVEDKFLEYAVLTTTGRRFTGMLAAETSNNITLDMGEGKQQVVLRNEIDQLRSSGKSLMPEGMEKDLTHEDLADVIEYVRATDEPPKQFPGNQPAIVRPDESGALHLLATNCKIYGPRIVFEQKYKNLGWWAREDDRAVWSIVVPKADRYRVTLDYASHRDAAGDHFLLTVAGKSLRGKVEATGTWDDYQQKEIGTIDLPAGAADVTFRSDGKIKSALIDLRGIHLELMK